MSDEELRAMAREELSSQQQPPIGDLVAQSVQGGRRARRIRNITVAASGVFTAVAVVAGVAVAGTVHHGGTSAITQSAEAKEPKAAPIAQPAGPKSPVTPAAVVEEARGLLPNGTTGGYARGAHDATQFAMGQIYLNRGQGVGMIRVFINKGALTTADCDPEQVLARQQKMLKVKEQWLEKADPHATLPAGKGPLPYCRTLPNGARVQIYDQGSEGLDVSVDHGNGVVVEVMQPNWLAYVPGSGNPQGRVTLSQSEATALAANPTWGKEMSSSLIAEAAKDFPKLPTVY
jgi:hypothetical protein